MNQQEWDAYLVEKAEIIDEAILMEANRAFFDEQINAFRSLWHKFHCALEKAKDKARADPALRYSDENMPPPKPGMILESQYVLDEPPKGFWREELSLDPEAYLARFCAPSMSGCYPPEEDTEDHAAALACEAAMWAATHDFALDAPAHNRLCPESDTWLHEIWGRVEMNWGMGDWNTVSERRRKLDASFRRVQAKWQVKVESSEEEPEDVNQRRTKKPAGTERDIAPAKRWTLTGLLKTFRHKWVLVCSALLLIVLSVLSLLIPDLRPWFCGSALIPLVVFILSLLGGRSASQQSELRA
jgi:hypothetical protein